MPEGMQHSAQLVALQDELEDDDGAEQKNNTQETNRVISIKQLEWIESLLQGWPKLTEKILKKRRDKLSL